MWGDSAWFAIAVMASAAGVAALIVGLIGSVVAMWKDTRP